MVEKIKHISNPLTVIAIFAALAEVAGTIALAQVDKELQQTFIWFVMLFPSLIVVLFFITLNFNPKVLYAPSDFKDEENFLSVIYGANKLSRDFNELDSQIESAASNILQEAVKRIDSANRESGEELKQIIEQQLDQIRSRVDSTREAAEDLNQISFEKLPKSAFQAQIMHILSSAVGGISASKIAELTGMSRAATQRSLEKLSVRGIVEAVGDGSDEYVLCNR